jgi:hypothetical protein
MDIYYTVVVSRKYFFKNNLFLGQNWPKEIGIRMGRLYHWKSETINEGGIDAGIIFPKISKTSATYGE